jgi:CheY-like chemotaxis protein
MTPSNSPERSAHRGRLRQVEVLIVEDDPAGARLLVALFLSEGAIVRKAGSAEEALLMLRDFPAKVLVVDVMLPVMGGLALVEECRSLFSDRPQVAIAVSALNGPQLEARALQSGCAAFIHKPIDLEHLVRVVVAQLKGAR